MLCRATAQFSSPTRTRSEKGSMEPLSRGRSSQTSLLCGAMRWMLRRSELVADLPERGSEIMILGFPEFFEIGTTVMSTRGTIARLPDPAVENLCLYTATTNHGNSGGPVCDNTGRAIAVVRMAFKFQFGTYGGGIPSEQVVPFLQKYIPTFQPADETKKLEWPDVDAVVSRSTVLIQCTNERDRRLTLPDGDESSFQTASATSTARGTTRQASKKVVQPGDGCFEDAGCVACHASGDVKCPNCQNGTVKSTKRTPVRKDPVTGATIFQDDMVRVPCSVCDGSGFITCPVCHGSRRDPSLK